MGDDVVPCIVGGLVSNSENAGSNSRNGGIAGGRRPFCICCRYESNKIAVSREKQCSVNKLKILREFF